MKRLSAVLGVAGVLLAGAAIASAQTPLPEGVTQAQVDAALHDLSTVYGSPVVRLDQAKAICNDEQYLADCAKIGQQHDLFPKERAAQVDALLAELKGTLTEKLTQCQSIDCLVEVATSLARQLNTENPTLARSVDLTPQKVQEKRTIVETAKSLGVDIEACQTMDPDVASLELLRGCARLAKNKDIQRYIPQETRERIGKTDASIALKESLSSGQLQCGDGTLEGCGNFCLNPTAQVRGQGTTAIPAVCREIAQRFFGQEGVRALESGYTTVQKTFDTFAQRAQTVVFTTLDGRTLTDPASIGRYLEDAGQRGDVEAVKSGMDFLISTGLVTPRDKEFVLKIVGKVREQGAVNFETCRVNPTQCSEIVPEEERGQFATMGEVEKIMRTEMASRGVSDPSRCGNDPSLGEACASAARAALPQLERLAATSPQVNSIIQDIQQKIRFGEEGVEARKRVEEHLQDGAFVIGNTSFHSLRELETFCQAQPQQCLAETARAGVFSKDVAAEKYRHALESQYNATQPGPQGPVPPGTLPPSEPQYTPYPTFDRASALKQFEAWLDNPQGPPPVPGPPQPYSPYNPPYPLYQGWLSPYPQQTGTSTPYPPYPQNPICPQQYPPSTCPSGEYRQESLNELGCRVYGACIPQNTTTQPPPIGNTHLCPALPTVASCPTGEERVIAFSSPECGTYYACKPPQQPGPPPPGGGTTDCSTYGSGWHSMDSSGNCFNPSMTEYWTPGGRLERCSQTAVYGCSGSSPTTPPPSGQKEQIWNSYGLRSFIRSDADPARIESLKQACANVRSQATVWTPNAGTASSPDFGMPDPNKCARAAACTAEQYFDGASCVSSPTVGTTTGTTSCPSGQYWNGSACVASPPSCPSGQYWNGSSCVPSSSTPGGSVSGSCSSELIGLLGSGCHTMGNAWFNGEMKRYVLPGTQTVRDCTIEYLSGCTSGSGGATATSCPSGQYWNGSSCVPSPSSSDPQQGCTQAGGTWNSSTNYCQMPTTSSSTSCPSGQYWNGTSCVISSPPPASSSSCPADQYWNGSACVSSSYTPPPSSPPPSGSSPPPPVSYFCPSGHDWNGSYCTLAQQSSFAQYTASVLYAFLSLFGL